MEEKIYAILNKERQGQFLAAVIAVALGIIGFALGIVLLSNKYPWGIFLTAAIIPGIIIFMDYVTLGKQLRASLHYLAITGQLEHIGEIVNKQYAVVKKACFSQHYIYCPGALVATYNDVRNVRKFKGRFVFNTPDGTEYRVFLAQEDIQYLYSRQDKRLHEN